MDAQSSLWQDQGSHPSHMAPKEEGACLRSAAAAGVQLLRQVQAHLALGHLKIVYQVKRAVCICRGPACVIATQAVHHVGGYRY